VSGIPHAFILDRSGNVAYHNHPMEPDFEQQLDKVSKQAPPKPAEPARPIPNVVGMTESQLKELSAADLKAVLRYVQSI